MKNHQMIANKQSIQIIPENMNYILSNRPRLTNISQADSAVKSGSSTWLTKLPKSKSSDESWHTTHQQFVQYGRNAKEWLRKCILLLPQIEKQQIWRKKRFKNIYEYAGKLAGMSHHQVNEALRVLHKAEIFPSLMQVIEKRGINAVKPVLGIISEENESLLTEKAMIMNKNTLEVFVRHFRRGEVISYTAQSLQITGFPRKPAQSANLQSLPFQSSQINQSVNPQSLPPYTSAEFFRLSPDSQIAPSSTPSLPPPPETSPKVTIAMQLDPKIADQLQKIKGQSDWNETISLLLKLREEKLEQEKPEIVEDATRPMPAAIENYVIAKTNGTCAFPGCQKPYDILHHTNRFAMYHTHDPDHIVPLCEAHERLAHLGLVENEDEEPKFWKIRSIPDYEDPRYEVDRVVEKYRTPN